MGTTRIRLLGRLSIDGPDVPTPPAFPGRRSELVFAILAAEHRRDVSRDELANALWPQELPDAWAAALRSVVSDVRRVLEASGLDAGAVLQRTGDGYRLQLPSDAVLDIDEARAALVAARARAGQDPGSAATDAARAAELAELPFLPRHDGDWVAGVRRELSEIRAGALELAARTHLRAGDMRAAAAAAARLVDAEPYSDAAHRLRIEVLGAAGDRAGAQRAYEQCRTTFDEVLGIEPSAETQGVLRRALEATSRAPAAAPASAASPLAGLAVLVVDDHDFQRRTAVALLERLGVGSLAEARDGNDALELLARSPSPDVIVCDIDMPGMDGVEFIRHVAERRLASAIVIASGLDRSVVQAVHAVGEGYGLQLLGAVEKPLTARRLSELLGSYRRPPAGARAQSAAPTDDELRAALDAGRIGARFVPIVDVQLGALSGATAVAIGEGDEIVPPRTLTDHVSAEVAAQLTDGLFAVACGQSRALREAGLDIAVSVAIAGQALTDVAHADRLLAIAREHDADPRGLVCAVGERRVRRSTSAELEVLTRLRVKGFGVCLDDYGGGRVSDDALARVPLTAVALAPALVTGAAGEPSRAAALEEALESVRELGLPAIACGCHDARDYDLLLQVGCRHLQGEFIAGALTGEELAAWARDWVPPSIASDSR